MAQTVEYLPTILKALGVILSTNKPGMELHPCSPLPPEVGISEVQGHLQLDSEFKASLEYTRIYLFFLFFF